MKRKIFLACLTISVLATLICTSVSASISAYLQKKNLTEELLETLQVLEQDYDILQDSDSLTRTISHLLRNKRVTIIAPDGTVLGDSQSDYRTMDNHAGREEIAGAFAAGTAVATRPSPTLDREMLYVARKAENGAVLRLAVPLSNLRETSSQLMPAFFVGLAAALLFSQLFSRRISASLIKPVLNVESAIRLVSQGSGSEIPPSGFDELDGMIGSINTLSRSIAQTLQELENERNKAQFMFDHMDEGLLLVDDALRVQLINRSVKELLGIGQGADCSNLTRLTYSKQLLEAVDQVRQENTVKSFDLEQPERNAILAVKLAPAIWSSGQRHGVMIVLSDVTQIRRTEQIRSEFVANASHELKSPITSIKGFTELLLTGVVTDPAKAQDYLQRILSESQRMMHLTENILRLSALESSLVPENTLPMNLLDSLKEYARELEPQAAAAQVSLRVEGDDVSLTISPDHLRQIFLNLLSNAIKYNKKGGSVLLRVRSLGDRVSVCVQDTGIGIPAANQSRVFERFFRVDKGRSRALGSTGLGLSIVKHTVALYQGELSLESREGQGTSITVTLPLEPPAKLDGAPAACYNNLELGEE